MINNWSIYDYIGIITTKSKVLQLIINIWSIDNQHLINWWSPVDQLIITNDQQFINRKDLFVLFLITQVHRNDNYMINSLLFKDQQLIKYWSIAYQIIKWLIVCLSFCFFSYFVCLLYCLFVCFLFFFGLYITLFCVFVILFVCFFLYVLLLFIQANRNNSNMINSPFFEDQQLIN